MFTLQNLQYTTVIALLYPAARTMMWVMPQVLAYLTKSSLCFTKHTSQEWISYYHSISKSWGNHSIGSLQSYTMCTILRLFHLTWLFPALKSTPLTLSNRSRTALALEIMLRLRLLPIYLWNPIAYRTLILPST
jgi:hypothetical protein